MLLEAKDIRVSFRKENQTRLFGRERQEVLHGLSIDLKEGECLGIIGESGSGKSTFGRVLCGLLAPDSGTVRLDGLDLYGRLPRADKARIQSSISIVFSGLHHFGQSALSRTGHYWGILPCPAPEGCKHQPRSSAQGNH